MSYQTHSKTLALCLGVMVLSLSLTYLVLAAWTEPGSLPPGGNVPAPINVGTTTQVKLGDLGVKGIFASYGGSAATSLVVVGDKVGIATATPAYTLDIKGPLRLQPTATPTAANGVIYYNSSKNKFQCYQGSSWIDCIGTGGGGPGGTSLWATSSANPNNIYNTNSGNVGIGTTTPAGKLDVVGNAPFIMSRTKNTAVDSNSWFVAENDARQWWLGAVGTDADKFQIALPSDPKLTIDTSGNVGIGTTAPGVKLEVSAGNGSYVRSKSSQSENSGYTWAGFQIQGAVGGVATNWSLQGGSLTGGAASQFSINNDGNSRIWITNTGNVGIGTTAPTTKLSVSGDIYASGDVCNGAGQCLKGETSLVSTVAYVGGTNPSCPSGYFEVQRFYPSASIPNSSYCYGCSTPAAWSDPLYPPSCGYGVWDGMRCGSATLYASTYTKILCAKNADPTALIYGVHNAAQCTAAGGTVVPTGDGFNQCRFTASVSGAWSKTTDFGTCGNIYQFNYACNSATCHGDIQCPGGWTPYKNFISTEAATCSSCGSCTTPAQSWGNQGVGGCIFTPQPWGCSGCGCAAGSTCSCPSHVYQVGCY